MSSCFCTAGHSNDSLPEWSKGVDSSSTSASCVGSNPTAVIFTAHLKTKHVACRARVWPREPPTIQVPGIEPETFSVLG